MNQEIIQELGDGLILRRAARADADKLVAFHADVFRDPGLDEADEGVAAWTRDLMERPHPTFNPTDFTLVEDVRTRDIVSSVCLISQTWSYGGVEFGVGRPELVGTHPDYRRRGLVRAQLEEMHRWSAERGERVQAITGIPWYYRQFGYEMAMTLGGGRVGYQPQVPILKDGEAEPYRVRPATEADLPFIAQLYERGARRSLVTCRRNEALWQYELAGRSEKNVNRRELRVVETASGEPVGFLTLPTALRNGRMVATAYELRPGVSWLAVSPPVVRYLWEIGERVAARDPKKRLRAFAFFLGTEHPAYRVLHSLLPHIVEPYAWYLRVPDLPEFVRHISVVLQQRLNESVLVGHSAELKVSFYRDGLRLVFDRGRLTGVGPWQPAADERGDAAFPDLTFVQLLFGYRSLDELKHAFADCWTADDEARALLDILFPKQPSDVWPVS